MHYRLLQRMRDAVAGEDGDALRQAAHSLKSSSANLGATQLATAGGEEPKRTSRSLGRSQADNVRILTRPVSTANRQPRSSSKRCRRKSAWQYRGFTTWRCRLLSSCRTMPPPAGCGAGLVFFRTQHAVDCRDPGKSARTGDATGQRLWAGLPTHRRRYLPGCASVRKFQIRSPSRNKTIRQSGIANRPDDGSAAVNIHFPARNSRRGPQLRHPGLRPTAGFCHLSPQAGTHGLPAAGDVQ